MLPATAILENKNVDRAGAFAKAIALRDDALAFDVLDSLMQMSGLEAHDILDRASDLLSSKDRTHMEALISAFQSAHAFTKE